MIVNWFLFDFPFFFLNSILLMLKLNFDCL